MYRLHKIEIKIKPTDRPYKYMSMRREPENLFGVALETEKIVKNNVTMC